MANILLGKDVVEAMKPQLLEDVEKLLANGCVPCVTVVKVGSKEDDTSYVNAIISNAEKIGVEVRYRSYPEGIKHNDLVGAILACNIDPTTHGILLLSPLPSYLDEDVVRNSIAPSKDIDGITDAAMANLYSFRDAEHGEKGFAPCTAEAVIDAIDYIGEDLDGKNVVVIGRSTIIGKPVALLFLERNATVTICHTGTINLQSITKRADIVVVAAGVGQGGRKARLGAEYFSEGQIIIDVGVNVDDDGLYGDVDTDAVIDFARIITPVPGGLGQITTYTLLRHVIAAAKFAKSIPQSIKERWMDTTFE